MSSFKALNLESDSESDDEIDNTKEIQIEDALKLYHIALKLHSEGPAARSQAKAAYNDLFRSDIFRYPESLSEWTRSSQPGVQEEFDYAVQDDAQDGAAQLPNTGDNAPNTLPQILHLAYKNHGQIMIDDLVERHKQYMRQIEETGEVYDINVRGPQLIGAFKNPLGRYAEALDKDDTDLELWSRTASIAEAAGSERLARFCLEAVLDGDDEGLDSVLRMPGLQETRALEQLRNLITTLEDDLSAMQEPMSSSTRKKLSQGLKKRLITQNYPGLKDSAKSYKEQVLSAILPGPQPQKLQLHLDKPDWALLGDTILKRYQARHGPGHDPAYYGPGLSVEILFADTSSHKSLTLPVINSSEQVDGSAVPKSSTGSPQHQEQLPEDGPQTSNVDVTMTENPKDSMIAAKLEATTLVDTAPDVAPSRKRSTDSAGLPETAEGGRGRSKRLRARETLPEGEQAPDPASAELAKQQTNQLWNFDQADLYLFAIAGDLYGRVGVENLGTSASVRELLDRSSKSPISPFKDTMDTAMLDLFTVLPNCTPQTITLLSLGDSIDQMGALSREAGLNAFLGSSQSANTAKCSKPTLDREAGLVAWVSGVNSGWASLRDAALRWVTSLLRPGHFPNVNTGKASPSSSYMTHQWPEDLKRVVVQMIVHLDEHIYSDLSKEVSTLNDSTLAASGADQRCKGSETEEELAHYVQNLFELHLDIYALIKHPGSGVAEETQISQRDRLERWALLARDVINLYRDLQTSTELDELTIRHLWASAFQVSVCEDVPQSHIIACIEAAKEALEQMNEPVIHLQNNAIMPEISVTAAERELAKINMKDFFLKVFDHDDKDPVAVIESLEPILEPYFISRATHMREADGQDQAMTEENLNADAENDSNVKQMTLPTPYGEMCKFLESANVSLRLSLWQRLREAYSSIDYPPKVISCYLRSMELVIGNLKSSLYSENPEEQRGVSLLEGIRMADEIILKIMALAKSCQSPFDCLDDDHLASSMNALADLLRLLSVMNVYEDQLRVGKLPMPTLMGKLNINFTNISGRLHDTYVRTWVLQYLLLRESMTQNPELFPTPEDEKLELLRHIHYAVGLRGYGHASNRLLLKLLKDELLQFDGVVERGARDAEMCQTLFDLYGIKCFSKAEDVMDYAAPPDTLDRKTASQLLPFVMSQAQKISLKDLHKTELKNAVDKVHGALGKPKASEDMATNRSFISAYLKSPIRPTDLFRCLHGIGTLSTKPIDASRAVAASKGWNFLMGIIALNKFRSQKKAQGNPTEELNIAVAFFMHDLEYSVERWETWYRMAQTYDSLLEDSVSWNAEKLNSNSHEILQYQRSAIHCYKMAVACAVRHSDFSDDERDVVAELYADFGILMYASTREPFSMQAFTVKTNEQRWYSRATVQPGLPFVPLTNYTAWKYAGTLFKRAIVLSVKNDRWIDHYMLAKSLWKMHNASQEVRGQLVAPSTEDIITALAHSIGASPEKKGRDPILEPHYKLVSIVDKLVKSKELEVEAACEILQETHYARKYGKSHDADEWQSHILRLLNELRNADKSNWHHRISARYAHVLYDDDASNNLVAQAAKAEFTKQMVTKTMALNIWKPEHERPGRHFVYTTRYTRFFLQLLVQLNDRASLEALTKRVRRKPHDFFEHTQLWQDICLAYLKMLRRAGNVPEGYEDTVLGKSLSLDDFSIIANRLESWMQSSETSSNELDILREVVELKKVNNGLMKSLVIDDLIGDTYAMLYDKVGRTLPPLPAEAVAASAAAEAKSAPVTNGAVPPAPHRPSTMSLTNLMNIDGAADRQSTSINIPGGSASSLAPPPIEPTPRPRFKGVGRREIAKRSEASLVRGIAAAPHSRIPATPTGNQTVEVVIRSPSVHRKSFGLPTPTHLIVPSALTNNAETSAPGSIHDSADDESELSDPADFDDDDDNDDEELQQQAPAQVRKPLFPNLLKAKREEDEGLASSIASPEAVTADEGVGDDDDAGADGADHGDEDAMEDDEVDGNEEVGDGEEEEEVFEEAEERHDDEDQTLDQRQDQAAIREQDSIN